MTAQTSKVLAGANQMDAYLPIIKNKTIGIVGNHNSLLDTDHGFVHVVDTLHQMGITIAKVFGPEHGFRGKAPDGEKINDDKDAKTKIPIVSLYGKHRKPTPEMLSGIELMVFDMQSVGVRFYTYLSTLHYILEACAENDIPLLLLDRPNPNGYYIDGPVLEPAHQSFVGMHPIPIVYGMTLGEMAKMIIGEQWLETEKKPELTIIPIKNYHRQRNIDLPLPPSPNLPNAQAIALYPSLCLLEPTVVSVGRGTQKQFQIYGHPDFTTDFRFTPQPNDGSKYPKLEGVLCYGFTLENEPKPSRIRLDFLMQAYAAMPNKEGFFLKTFERIVGNDQLRKQLQQGVSEAEIRASWEPQLSEFKTKRQRYLIYPDE